MSPEHHGVRVWNVGTAGRLALAAAGSGLVIYGVRRGSWSGLLFTAWGAETLYRAATGYSPAYRLLGLHSAARDENTSVPYELGVRVEHAVVVRKPAAELYAFWRNLENVPRFMARVKRIEILDDTRSRWRVAAPFGSEITWLAGIHHEEENRLIGWRSLPGSQLETAGSVTFRELPAGRGTEVRVLMRYNPPAGLLAAGIARLMRHDAGARIREALRRFKSLMETGEASATEDQPSARRVKRVDSGRRHPSARERHWPRTDEVQLASEESFPASDPPSWTPVV